jgi:hypothetical protein
VRFANSAFNFCASWAFARSIAESGAGVGRADERRERDKIDKRTE